MSKEVDVKFLTVPDEPLGPSLDDVSVSVGDPITVHLGAFTPMDFLGSSYPGGRMLRSNLYDVRTLRVGRFGISSPTGSRTPGLGVGSHVSYIQHLSIL